MDTRLFKVLSVTYTPALATAAIGSGAMRRRPAPSPLQMRRLPRPTDLFAKRPIRAR